MWANGGPGNHIPTSVKRAIRARQQRRCTTIDPNVCTGSLDEYDHIVNTKTSGIPRHQATASEIQGLCKPCHNIKTQREAHAAKRAKTHRDPLPHPGLVGRR
jgi:5-methylcytosine-specific restriction endonuclease McrA